MKQRRIRSILIAILTVMSVNIFIPKIHAAMNDNNIEFSDKYEKVDIVIKHGDRAWDIQSELTPNEDIREILYHVGVENDESVNNLQPGHEMTFFRLANEN